MPANNYDKSRVGNHLAGTVLQGMMARMKQQAPAGLMAGVGQAKRQRLELLDLLTPADQQRWQLIHNDADRYQFISEKFSMIRGEDTVDYRCLIIYYELGDEVPLVKVGEELRSDDEKRLADAGEDPFGFMQGWSK